MVPVRATGSALAEIRYAIDPSPCPFADEANAIQDAGVVAVHVQSRSTMIEIVPDPPAEPYDVVGDETSGWHRDAVVLEGAATLVVAELPQARVSESRLPAVT